MAENNPAAGNRQACAALRYAAVGWRVHPCHPRSKIAVLKDWPNRATTDRSLIKRWWGRSPDCNVAVATGPISDLLVLDVDADRALAELERRHGCLPDCPAQWTGSGGGRWQAFFAYPAGRQIGNSAGRLGPKLDTRGGGGYVLVPPSKTVQAYRWQPDRSPWHLLPPPPPDWLVDLLDPPVVERQPWTGPSGSTSDASDPYCFTALERELQAVATAPVGRRNHQLNESAFRLLRLAADGRLDASAIAHALTAAALHAGLSEYETRRTIQSAASKRGVTL
jgi:hypothetical protein